jgi:hypothetical protein
VATDPINTAKGVSPGQQRSATSAQKIAPVLLSFLVFFCVFLFYKSLLSRYHTNKIYFIQDLYLEGFVLNRKRGYYFKLFFFEGGIRSINIS